ncbi:MAG: hypothetical protein QGH39_08680 [Candidatus Thermoplasmatota archaeon]|jgi:small nuclear ribonucleoprotein (snRNP)-like protein|nr:hypothetical protein [Candidatus Thermoplasmatota archaeon]MDP7265618.1 hypothetical protein [Candidatus Thermoplasmatota archaeon]
MSLMMEKLQSLLGREIAIVTIDGCTLKGVLENFDNDTVILQDVKELYKVELKWDTPKVSPHAEGTDATSSVDAYGVVDTSKLRSSLKRVLIRYMYVIQIWPWELSDARKDISQYTLL